MGALTIVAKYLIEAAVEIQGLVDKPDIVGALFSQTEGLLGSELDLRNLQNTGRIGRIEVEVEHKGGIRQLARSISPPPTWIATRPPS